MTQRETLHKISVQNLVDFCLRSGDLGGSGFASNSRALLGTKAHKKLQKMRPEEYTPEVPLQYTVENEGLTLEISGRTDGIFLYPDRVIIEEIKSTLSDLDNVDENYSQSHWAQAKCYAYIYSVQNDLSGIEVQLTYYQLDTGLTKSLLKAFTLEELTEFFNALVRKYLAWAVILFKWRTTRDESLKQLQVPFSTYRRGQREMAVGVYKTIVEGKKLFVEAPTGIGKTLATLFPTLKAMGEGHLEKIFYLTAKTITREVAETTMAKLREHGLAFKSVTITAKEKICFKDEALCDPEFCEYARGYFDRVQVAIEDIFEQDNFNRQTIEDYAEKHQICPFEFALDLSLAADGIICDYNYVFDPRVYLKRFFMFGGGNYTFLVDESHNLVERAREMFSAELFKQPVLDLKRATKNAVPEICAKLDVLNNYFIKIRKLCQESEEDEETGSEARRRQNYIIEEELPEELLPLLEGFLRVTDNWLMRNHETDFREELLTLYFEVLNFLSVAEVYDERFVTYFENTGNDFKVKLFCLDPSALLKESLKRGRSAIFFSATLTPLDYFQEILGGETEDYKLSVSSPFPEENLCRLLSTNISTTYKNREFTYTQIVDAILAMIGGKRGNYLVFLPSYRYMDEVYQHFSARESGVQAICQAPLMSEEEREEFLQAFSLENTETLVGFAVMGGIFGEGIDLIGERLSGAVIVGVGLPQICLERDIIRGYFTETRGLGFEFAYVYPGMNKVLQAAGRVIRTETDRGVILLIDERFARPAYRDLLPRAWQPLIQVKNPGHIRSVLASFWK